MGGYIVVSAEDRVDKTDACEQLRACLTPGMTVYTSLVSVSRSGMSGHIGVYIVTDDQRIRRISHLVAGALNGVRYDRDGACIVSGCGMDMGRSLVYDLGYVLYPDGYECPGDSCPHGDHSNPPFPARMAGLRHPASNAFRQEWL